MAQDRLLSGVVEASRRAEVSSRFRLDGRLTRRGLEENEANFFYEVELEDASPC